jgi:hypothetical protein
MTQVFFSDIKKAALRLNHCIYYNNHALFYSHCGLVLIAGAFKRNVVAYAAIRHLLYWDLVVDLNDASGVQQILFSRGRSHHPPKIEPKTGKKENSPTKFKL